MNRRQALSNNSLLSNSSSLLWIRGSISLMLKTIIILITWILALNEVQPWNCRKHIIIKFNLSLKLLRIKANITVVVLRNQQLSSTATLPTTATYPSWTRGGKQRERSRIIHLWGLNLLWIGLDLAYYSNNAPTATLLIIKTLAKAETASVAPSTTRLASQAPITRMKKP